MKSRTQQSKISILLLTVVLLLSASCIEDAKEKVNALKEGVESTKQVIENTNDLRKNAESIKEDIERLKETEPLTKEELKAWMPGNVGNMERTAYKTGALGFYNMSSIEATYKLPNDTGNDQKKLTVTVIDGAGSHTSAAAISAYRMATQFDMEEESERRSIKTVTQNGITAKETYHKNRNETVLMFLYKNRFGINIDGVNMNPEETWEYVAKFDLDELL